MIPKSSILAALSLVTILALACSGSSDDELQELRDENATLRDQIASLTSTETSTPTSAPAASPTSVPPADTPSMTPSATPTPDPLSSAYVIPRSRLIANTGGDGVSVRDHCAEDSRAEGTLAEGSEVEVFEFGKAECEGWYVVRSGDEESWVHDDYLVPTPTPEPTPIPLTAPLVLEPGGGCSLVASGSFISYEGLVTNNTSSPMESVEAVVTYYTEDGTFVTSDSSLIDYQPVLAGQSSPFSVITTNNPAIQKCGVAFKEFFGGTIAHQPREP